MRITKFGHSCLLVEEGEAKILIDSGRYSFIEGKIRPEDFPDFDALLFTHEHGDHLDLEALPTLLKGHSGKIFSNSSVAALLRAKGFETQVLGVGEEVRVRGAAVRVVAGEHGLIADGVERPENIGFVIGNKFFHPGDSLEPELDAEVEILALPIAGPWLAIRESIRAVQKLKPRIVIPVHDAMLKEWFRSPYERMHWAAKEYSFEFKELEFGKAVEF